MVMRRFEPGNSREAWSNRDRFLSDGVASGRIRADIRRSWQRSRKKAVRPDGDPETTYVDFDPQGRLLRLAAPVLTRLAEQVSTADMAVILTDPNGLVLERRAGKSLMRILDQVLLAPGYKYSEETVGTNGIGTAAEDRRTAWVVGSEHYAEWLRGLSCAGAVIRDPITGRIEGVLDLTCRVQDTSPLMVPFINEAAREIERRLYGDQPPEDRVAEVIRAAENRAASEERRRLARELHDSVSQVLYGITLGVDTARDLLVQRPTDVAEPLEYIRGLATAGMTELRALIFELRPESLEKEGLVAALTKQLAAVAARHGLAVDSFLPTEPVASLETKETLFRICQEALHNIVKHAKAKRVWLRLEVQEADLVLQIADDGVGFDSGADFPGHLGLHSMHERAVMLGGHLDISASAGKGTCITARIPAVGTKETTLAAG